MDGEKKIFFPEPLRNFRVPLVARLRPLVARLRPLVAPLENKRGSGDFGEIFAFFQWPAASP